MKQFNNAFLNILSLDKTFGAKSVLSNVNFSVSKGEFVSIIGPSGSGKTTLLKMIAGIIRPTSGQVFFREKEITNQAYNYNGIVMVWQSLALFSHMNVEGNVGFGLDVQKISKTEKYSRVSDILEMVGLANFNKRRISRLSGGEKQRVALARALIVKPDLILLDEPFGSLDKALRRDILNKIRQIHKETEITFIMVTHDQDEAMVVSDRMIIMNSGMIEQIGKPKDIFDRPNSSFVANFFGEKNILRVSIVDFNHSFVNVKTDSGIELYGLLPSWKRFEIRKDMEVAYVIDECKISVNNDKENNLEGILNSHYTKGHQDCLEVFFDDMGFFRCKQKTCSEYKFVNGNKIKLSWGKQDAYILPLI